MNQKNEASDAAPAKVEVVVAPVCVWRDPQGALQLQAFRPTGKWLSRPLASGEDPAQVAAELIAQGTVAKLSSPPVASLNVHPVGFITVPSTSQRVELLYTLGIPWGLETRMGADWTTLPTSPRGDDDRSRGFAIRDGWQQLAKDTSAAVELLARYFTISELRDAYLAIWCRRGDANFKRWVEQNPGFVVEVSDEVVRHSEQNAARKAQIDSASGPAASPPAPLQSGIGWADLAGSLIGFAPAAVALSSVRGTRRLLGDQDAQRGRPPTYYQGGSLWRLENPYPMKRNGDALR